MRRGSLLIGVGIAACAWAPAAWGRTITCAPPPSADTRLGEIDGNVRLRWIDHHLGQEASKGRFWSNAWMIGIGAAGVGSLAVVPFVAPENRIDWYTSAGSAAIGVVPFLVSPLTVIRDAPKLHAAVEAVPPDDQTRVCALLVDAEGKLAAAAANEHWQRGWWTHVGNVAFNTGVLLFLGLGYHHWTSGIINGVSGAAVGETIILTQPTGAIDHLGSYNRGELGGP